MKIREQVLASWPVVSLVAATFVMGCGNGPDTGAAHPTEAPVVAVAEESEAPVGRQPTEADPWAPGSASPYLRGPLPTKDEVPYPAYPGALIYLIEPMSDERSTRVSLLSEDEAGDIYAFYKERLAGWQSTGVRDEFYGYLIWEHPYLSEGAVERGTDVTVEIRSLHKGEIDMVSSWMPGAQTEIRALYRVVPEVPLSEVGVPIYPGLLGRYSQDAGWFPGSLPLLVAVSEDSFEDVLAFYSAELAHWNHTEARDMHFFYPGDWDDEYEPVDLSMTNVSIWLAPGDPVTVRFRYETP